MEVTVKLTDIGVFSGEYKVRDLNTLELAKIQDQVARKYRKLSNEGLRTMVAREIFAKRLIGWNLENGPAYSQEKVYWIFDNRPDIVSLILDEADELINQALEQEFLD